MHFDISPPLAFLEPQPWMIGVILPLFGLIAGGTVAISAMYFHHRRKELWHQTARIALEKGQPIPAMPTVQDVPDNPRAETSNDLRGGLVLIGAGLGLFVFLNNFIGYGIAFVGAIPGFIGLALLISGIVRFVFTRKESVRNARSS